MQHKLKVLHVIPSISPLRGGPSTAVIEMVSALRASGVDAEIATTNDNGDTTLTLELNKLIQHQGVPIRFFKRFSPPLHAAREFAYSYSFQRWIKKHITDYDVIHIHALFSFCPTYTMYQARKQGINYVIHLIGQLETWSLNQSKQRKEIYLNLIERRNISNAKAIQFTAKSEQQQALKTIPSLNGEVIPLGVTLQKEISNANSKMIKHWSLQKDTPTFIYLSRLHPKKGLELLLEALSTLGEQTFQLVIAGNGDPAYIDSLKATVLKLNLVEQCHFVGFVESYEKNLLLQGADVFVLTSHSENFGIAVLEAMVAGTPVLLSKGVALSQQVEQHNLGYVTDLKIENLRSTLNQVLNNKHHVEQTGLRAAKYVKQHYDWKMLTNKIIELYK